MTYSAKLLMFAVLVSAASSPWGETKGTFLLTVPELKLEVSENTTTTLPRSFINRLEVQLFRSSQEVSPGKVLVRVNGEAANTIMSTRTGEATILCDLDLNRRPGFLLHAGRNAIEASAESIYGRAYYATFLLDVRDEPESLREVQRETTLSKPGEQPPLIELLNPQGPVESVHQLDLRGYVEGAAPLTLTVQGATVALTSRGTQPGTRGIQLGVEGTSYSFNVPLKISGIQDSIELIAVDAHGNRMRLVIPVIQGIRTASQRYALIIGVSRYQDSRINRLDYADRDAEAMRAFLLNPKGGAVPLSHLRYLINEDATLSNIRSALFDFLAEPGPDDLVIVYFAGHGTNDQLKRPDNYYLLGYDTRTENIGGSALPMWDLQAAFERTVQANVISLVDACHSAAMGQTVPNMTNQRWIKAGYGLHRAIITASDVNETSREGPQWGGGHGVFTFFLLQALQGGADLNHDHQITVGELFDYVRSHVRKETEGAQTPTAQAGLARGLVLTQSAPSARHNSGSLKLPSGGGL